MTQPMDIKSQNFRKGLFGYNKVDVDQYVDTVSRAYDELFTENKNLRDEKDRLNKVIEENRLKLFELENQVQGVTPVKEEKKAEMRRVLSHRYALESIEWKKKIINGFEDKTYFYAFTHNNLMLLSISSKLFSGLRKLKYLFD